MSRPRTPKNRKREDVINIVVSTKEKKIFQGLAEQRRQSMSEMVRQILFREAGTTSKVA